MKFLNIQSPPTPDFHLSANFTLCGNHKKCEYQPNMQTTFNFQHGWKLKSRKQSEGQRAVKIELLTQNMHDQSTKDVP
jgi:hypothetical protein